MVGASRSGVVASNKWLVWVLICSRVRSNSGAGVGSVVRMAIISGSSGSKSSSRSGTSHFGVAETSAPSTTALPELDTASASIVVGRAGTKALLLLVMTTKRNLDKSCNEEEDAIKELARVTLQCVTRTTYAPAMATAKLAEFKRHAVPNETA